MAVSDALQDKREEILRICAKYGARNGHIFGSTVWGQESAQSGLDLWVELEEVVM